jgi:hypothetical protein
LFWSLECDFCDKKRPPKKKIASWLRGTADLPLSF